MLIIGHRGAAGLAPENTLDSLRAGFDAGADILEFDVHVTIDGVPILSHNARLHGKPIRKHTLSQLRKSGDITTLDDVLKTFYGKVLLNIELKQATSVSNVVDCVAPYIRHKTDWDDVIFSSFRLTVLRQIRSICKYANLALLHHVNPFLFMVHHKQLQLSAVGFHRLHVNPLALAVAQKLGIFTYVYTVDRTDTAKRLARRHIDGIVTNYPDRIASTLQADA